MKQVNRTKIMSKIAKIDKIVWTNFSWVALNPHLRTNILKTHNIYSHTKQIGLLEQTQNLPFFLFTFVSI